MVVIFKPNTTNALELKVCVQEKMRNLLLLFVSEIRIIHYMLSVQLLVNKNIAFYC